MRIWNFNKGEIMYPGDIDFEWRNGEVITSLDPEWKKPKLPKINFNDPESPDYISASPAFDAYFENKRSECSEEFRQSMEQARRVAMRSKFMLKILRPLVIVSGFCLWLFFLMVFSFPQITSYLVK